MSHRMNLDEAPRGYDLFMRKEDAVMKIVLRSWRHLLMRYLLISL